MLNVSYEATPWAALPTAARRPGEAGVRRIFLMCLGSSVFENSLEWAIRSMRRACEKFRGFDLDIRIATYSGKVDPLLRQSELVFARETAKAIPPPVAQLGDVQPSQAVRAYPTVKRARESVSVPGPSPGSLAAGRQTSAPRASASAPARPQPCRIATSRSASCLAPR